MAPALFFAAPHAGFVDLSGSLFGPSSLATAVAAGVVGVAAWAASAGAGHVGQGVEACSALAQVVCLAAVLGGIADAADCWINLAVPGNCHAWALIGPFVARPGFIGITAKRPTAEGPTET